MFGRKKTETPLVEVKKGNTLIFLGYLVLGFYFINKKFLFIKIPEKFVQFDEWIIVAGGLFLLFGALHYLKSRK